MAKPGNRTSILFLVASIITMAVAIYLLHSRVVALEQTVTEIKAQLMKANG